MERDEMRCFLIELDLSEDNIRKDGVMGSGYK